MDYLAWLESEGRLKPCPNCGEKESLRHIRTDDGPNFAKIVCDNLECGGERFVMWGAKPDNLKKSRPARHTKLLRKARGEGRTRCEMCLRHESDLPGTQVLMAHHVDPYQRDGDADLANVWILCTACHRLVEWARTYFGHYHPEEVTDAIAPGD